VLTVQIGQTTDTMYIGYFSNTLPANGMTDYLARVVKPKLDSIEGVQTAEVIGRGNMRCARGWTRTGWRRKTSRPRTFTTRSRQQLPDCRRYREGTGGERRSDRLDRSALAR
jgi:hypothetical protein